MSGEGRARHQWDKVEVHRYRCRVCGCEKVNEEGPREFNGMPPRWIARFEWGGQVRIGRTPPCPGHPARSDAVPAPSSSPTPDPAPAVGAEKISHAKFSDPASPIQDRAPGLRPVREFLPLLAGPADQVADAYRAWLTRPRPARGGCWACRHWRAGDLCAHPTHGPTPVPADRAREGAGWPLVPPGSVTLVLRPTRAGAAYQEGGRCGPGAVLWQSREAKHE